MMQTALGITHLTGEAPFNMDGQDGQDKSGQDKTSPARLIFHLTRLVGLAAFCSG